MLTPKGMILAVEAEYRLWFWPNAVVNFLLQILVKGFYTKYAEYNCFWNNVDITFLKGSFFEPLHEMQGLFWFNCFKYSFYCYNCAKDIRDKNNFTYRDAQMDSDLLSFDANLPLYFKRKGVALFLGNWEEKSSNSMWKNGIKKIESMLGKILMHGLWKGKVILLNNMWNYGWMIPVILEIILKNMSINIVCGCRFYPEQSYKYFFRLFHFYKEYG